MVKKSRRARKKPSRKVSHAPVNTQIERIAAPAMPEVIAESAPDAQEYSYVVADLRQVAILAAAVFVLLIGLSFFIG